jgi:hypothetical protein
MESARTNGIRLQWLSLREGYSGQLYERYQRFLDKYDTLKQQGFTHAFLIDAPLITFQKPLQDMCEMVKDYQPNTLYAEALRGPNGSTYQGKDFITALQDEGVIHDSRILFGDLETLKAVAEYVLEFSRDFLSGAPPMGTAADCLLDKNDFAVNVGKYAEDAQFLMLLTSIYHPDIFKPIPMFLWDGPCADPTAVLADPNDALKEQGGEV